MKEPRDFASSIGQFTIPDGSGDRFSGYAVIGAGLITPEQLDRTLDEMQIAMDDPNVLVLMPRMSLVWAHKGR